MSDPTTVTEPATSEVALSDILADLRPAPPAAEAAPAPEPTPTEPAAPAEQPAEPAPAPPAAEVVEVAPPAAEPTPATPEAEPDYKAQYEALLKEHTQVVAGLNAPPAPAEPAPAATAPAQPGAAPALPQFVSEADFDEVVSSPAKFNEFCGRLVAETARVAHEAAVERVYREIPSLIGAQVNHQLESRVVSDAFFKDNPDVQAADPELFKREFLIQRNAKPGASMFELLRETATSMRSKGYVRPVKGTPAPGGAPSALVGGTTARGTAPRAKPALSGIAAQVNAEVGALMKGRA